MSQSLISLKLINWKIYSKQSFLCDAELCIQKFRAVLFINLIISIDEKCFFNKGEVRIKESSLDILDAISYMLVKLPNYCVIENHTEESDFTKNWELSVSRASNLAEYMIKYRKLPIEKVFSLGFGETMPFKDNVAPENGLNNRIDFVIIEYEARR